MEEDCARAGNVYEIDVHGDMSENISVIHVIPQAKLLEASQITQSWMHHHRKSSSSSAAAPRASPSTGGRGRSTTSPTPGKS